MSRIVVFGGLNMDLIVEIPVPAGPGETRFGTRFYTTPGGKGGNQAVAAARLLGGSGSVEMVGRVGADRFGEEMIEALSSAGVGARGVAVDGATTTGIATIFIDAQGENYVNAVYGANARCDAAELERLRATLDGARLLLIQQELPVAVTREAVEIARELGVSVILDPAPTREGLEDAHAAATVLTPNEHEAADLTGLPVTDAASAREAARRLHEAGPVAIVTLGEQGVWVEGDGVSQQIAAPPVDAVATVGAGDAFAGALAVGMVEGLPLLEAARLGVACAALSTTRDGAQQSMPSRREVDALLESGW
ncbi:MAG: ribokinase [Dehalococcoidia bacterium]